MVATFIVNTTIWSKNTGLEPNKLDLNLWSVTYWECDYEPQ